MHGTFEKVTLASLAFLVMDDLVWRGLPDINQGQSSTMAIANLFGIHEFPSGGWGWVC